MIIIWLHRVIGNLGFGGRHRDQSKSTMIALKNSDKPWHLQIIEYYSVLKRNELDSDFTKMVTELTPDFIPLQRTKRDNYSLTRPNWENSRTWGWGWSTTSYTHTHHRNQEKLHRKGRSDYMLNMLALPRAVQHHMERSPLSLPFLWGKKESGRDIQPIIPSVGDCLVGAPTLVLPHEDYRGVCRAQLLGIWLWRRWGEELVIISTQILAD